MLGVQRSAEQKKIRLAYFSLAKKHHPDLNAHKSKRDHERATKKFQEINDAYQVLSDRVAKTRYDSIIGNMQANDDWQ